MLKGIDPGAFLEFFTPTVLTARLAHSPAGLHDLPRPFVFRFPGEEVGINLFRLSSLDLVCRIMSELNLTLVGSPKHVRISLAPGVDPAREPQALRVRFLTPTELKGTHEPAFGPLLARIRDRLSTLRAAYGPGPLELDFRAFGERAGRVSMTRCELQWIEQERRSKHTGQTHPLGGFVGLAEYAGDLAEFIPYLEAARWTGVGRQTVWGKGEIAPEILNG